MVELRLAADLGPYNPPPPRYEPVYEQVPEIAASNWQGLYLGVNAGYGWGNDNATSFNRSPAAVRSLNPAVGSAAARSATTRNSTGLCSVSKPTCRAPTSARPRLSRGALYQRRPTSTGSPLCAAASACTPVPHFIYFTGGWAFADLNRCRPNGSNGVDEQRRHRDRATRSAAVSNGRSHPTGR